MYHFQLDHNGKKFLLYTSKHDWESRQEVNEYLNKMFIFYGEKEKAYNFSNKNIFDVVYKFNYDGIDFSFTDVAQTFVNNYRQNYKAEQKYFRGVNVEYNKIVKEPWGLLPYQKQGVEFITSRKRSYLADEPGLGKEQPLDAKILTPSGWTTMGEIKENDFVIGLDGQPKKVLKTFYQGVKDIYKVTFSDGSSTECGGEHLWAYYTKRDKLVGGRKLRVNTLSELVSMGLKTSTGIRKFRLPEIEGFINFQETPLNIPPYILGCLLGDGGLSQPRITFSSPDEFIINKINNLLDSNYFLNKVSDDSVDYTLIKKDRTRTKNIYVQYLKDLSLMGTHSNTKFIPKEYLISSEQNRIDLLQGLMDTDGYVFQDGKHISYTTVSKQLCEDFCFLARSLGCKAIVHNAIKYYTYKGEKKQGQLAYTITVFPKNNMPLFSFPRKKDLQTNRDKYSPTRLFDRVEFVGKKEAKCILIDSPDHLYITDYFIPTHNTIQAIVSFSHWYLEGNVDKIILVVKTGLPYNWKHEILQFSKIFSEDDIVLINNNNKQHIFDNPDIINKKIIITPNHLLKPIFLSYKKNTEVKASAKTIRWTSFVDIQKKLGTTKLCLVIDEAHELTNSRAISTKAMLAHIKYFDYRICLSATPTGNYFERYFNSMELLDDKALQLTEMAFKYYIGKTIDSKYGIMIDEYNYDNIQKIRDSVLSLYFKKRLKSEVPEMKFKRIIKPIFVEFSSQHERLYRLFLNEEIAKLEEDIDGAITRFNIMGKFPYLIQCVENPELLKGKVEHDEINELLGKWRFDYDEKLLLLQVLLHDYINVQGDKVIVFDNHPKTLNMLADKFKGFNPIVLHGQLGDTDDIKEQKQNRFNDRSSDNRLLLGNPAVCGTGLNFNKGARRVIYLNAPFNAVLFEQSLDRIYRINNTEDALIDVLIYDKSLDVLRHNSNTNRMKVNSEFLNKNLTKDELKSLLEMKGI